MYARIDTMRSGDDLNFSVINTKVKDFVIQRRSFDMFASKARNSASLILYHDDVLRQDYLNRTKVCQRISDFRTCSMHVAGTSPIHGGSTRSIPIDLTSENAGKARSPTDPQENCGS